MARQKRGPTTEHDVILYAKKNYIYRYDFVCLYIWIKFIVSFTFVSSKTEEKNPNKTKNDPQRLRIWHTYKWHFFGSCSLGANHIDEKNTHWTNATREKNKNIYKHFQMKDDEKKNFAARPNSRHSHMQHTHQCVFVTEFSNFLENCCYFRCLQMPVFRFVYIHNLSF